MAATERNASNHDAALRVANELRAAGHVAYFAGGCVRDGLLGLDPKDYDVATDATPDEITSIFHRTRGVGQAFGVVLVNLLGHSIEVTTFRSDGPYDDCRRPSVVTYADAPADARRRDFTINGLFQDPATNTIIDYVGGQDDLARGVIRAIGDPEARLSEDRLRMLRAVRFAARFGFSIDGATADAIRTGASALEGVSRERIGHEIQWMLAAPTRATAARLAAELGLDRPVLLEDTSNASVLRLSNLDADAGFALALAAWWLDRHPEPIAEGIAAVKAATRPWRAALMLSNETWEAMASILAVRTLLQRTWSELSVAGRKRLMAGDSFADALEVFAIESPAQAVEIHEEATILAAQGISPDPLVDGSDLISLGLRPGPRFKRLLDGVYDAQLEGRVKTRAESLDLLKQLASRSM